jgi:ATP-dependent HslUV protease subunit HslV
MGKAPQSRSTTVLAVRRDGRIAVGGDGQVTLGETIVKHSAAKIRKLRGGEVLVGFAGATADAFSLLERFEGKLDEHAGQVRRASIELAKLWRTDRVLRRLESMMIVAGGGAMLLLSGQGDVIEPDDDVLAIGSGGPYAKAAARALLENTKLPAREIVEKSLTLAAELCVYTNDQLTIEQVG